MNAPARPLHQPGPLAVSSDDFNILATYFGQSLPVAEARAMNPTYLSARVTHATVPTGGPLCELGHQGLMHDEELDLVFSRARVLHPMLGRFMQRDPLAGGTQLPVHRPRGGVVGSSTYSLQCSYEHQNVLSTGADAGRHRRTPRAAPLAPPLPG